MDIPGVRVLRIPRFSFLGPVKVGPSWLKLFLDGFLFIWSAALIARNRYDFVDAHEESVFFCRWLKPIFRFKLVYDMHSSLPQQLRDFRFTRSKALIWLFEKLEEGSLRSSDAVITICPELASYALPRLPRPDRHFIGGTPAQVESFQALASRCGLDGHVLFTGRLDHRTARSLLSKAAVLTSTRTEGNNTPLKIYEQLASGIPLVATRIRSHTQVLGDEVCFLVEPEPPAIAAGIIAP